MLKKFALIALIATPLCTLAAAPEAGHEQALPRAAAPAASAASHAATERKTSGTKKRQLSAACKKKVDAAGVKGAADRKKAMVDCMKAS